MKYRAVRLARLVDANPKWTANADRGPESYLQFDCPIHEDCDGILIPVNPPVPQGWKREGKDFDDMTLTPSIAKRGEGCKVHMYVTNGAFNVLADSR